MNRGMRDIICCLILGLSTAFASEFIPTDEDTQEVARRLIGTFDSSQQANDNPSYVNVRLTACKVLVDPSEIYLYVEQTAVDFAKKPYRQRIYRIMVDRNSNSIESRIFKIENQEDLDGACSNPRIPLVNLEDLIDIECAVNLKKVGENYLGRTPESGCVNHYGGASRSTSEVSLENNLIRAWDRGYDSLGNQVWGPVSGPYLFRRLE